MGWASFREDVISRQTADTNNRPTSAVGLKEVKSSMASKLSEFTIATARPLPVLLLLDVSGSMASDGKIEALNEAVRQMVQSFAEEAPGLAEIHVSVLTFGGAEARVHLAPTPAKGVSLQPMSANGGTPFASLFRLAITELENKDKYPSRGYTPTLVLCSDGEPNAGDPWPEALSQLLNSPRACKAQRFAMAIGADADEGILKAFLANPEATVFTADKAADMRKFFRVVTMSVTSRSKSATPNVLPAPQVFDEESLRF